MAKLGEAYVDIVGKDTGLKTAMAKAQSDVNTGVTKMQARLKSFAAAMPAVGKAMTAAITVPLMAFGALSIKAYAEQEDALVALRSALDQVGDGSDQNMARFSAFSSEIQKATIYADELVMSTMAYGRNLGIQTEQLELATKAAAGLAAKYKIDLQSAMMLIGRASQGQTQMLTRYGIILDDTLTPQEKFNELLRIGAGAFGLAQARAQSTSGQILQLKNEFGDLQELIGEQLAPRLRELVDLLRRITETFANLRPETQKLLVNIGLFVAALGPLILIFNQAATAVKLLAAAFTFLLAHPVVAAIAVVVAASAAVWGLITALDAADRRAQSAPALTGKAKEIMDMLKDRAQAKVAGYAMPAPEEEAVPVEENTADYEMLVDEHQDWLDAQKRQQQSYDRWMEEDMNMLLAEHQTWLDSLERQREEAKARELAALREQATAQRSAWETVLDFAGDMTSRMIGLAEGETAGRIKAIEVEADARRDLIDAMVQDEERKALMLRAIDYDTAAQKQKLDADEQRREADNRRNRIGFVGGLRDVWRGAMTAGARLSIPEAPEVRYSREQVDELKGISDKLDQQIQIAKASINKLATAESML